MSEAPCDADLDTRDAREWLRFARCGDFEGAWCASDRIRRRQRGPADWTIPRHLQRVWSGADLAGQRVLVRCYHGLGDTIQFIRYAPLVRAVAKRVIVWAQEPLLPLLRSAASIDRLLPLTAGDPPVEYDVDIEVMELPYAFRTTLETIPRHVPYLAAMPLALGGCRPRVGIVWRAGAWEPRRSIEFETVRGLFDDTPVTWYALQGEPGLKEYHPNLRRIDTQGLLRLARAIRAMDLVISIDSMSAHLAGALGVPVWTLLPYEADWRWMQDRTDSPWYPTMRLFRQRREADWSTVIADVRGALMAFRDRCNVAAGDDTHSGRAGSAT